MPEFAVWMIFVAKHWLLANVYDIGFSYSRDQRNTFWFVGLAVFAGLTAGISYVVLSYLRHPMVWWVCSTEVLLAVSCCLVERKARIADMLRTHLLCELGSFVLYGFVAIAVWQTVRTA